jgi:acyl-coenzyme A thioesterase PaaI-like protein
MVRHFALERGRNQGRAMSRITKAEIAEIVSDALPFAAMLAPIIEKLKAGEAVVRVPFKPDFVRPGGTISGPVMMGLADFAMYVVVMSLVGRVELAAERLRDRVDGARHLGGARDDLLERGADFLRERDAALHAIACA